MNYYNRLISGDHKGYASLRMEQRQSARHTRFKRRQFDRRIRPV